MALLSQKNYPVFEMGPKEFNSEEAKNFLQERDRKEKQDQEETRRSLLEKTIAILKEELKDISIEVYLVGSILQPFAFTPHSDIDIVIKNYQGDRFDLWTTLEKRIGRKVEVILFESCSFKEFMHSKGLRVI